jgi:hypothetical protein
MELDPLYVDGIVNRWQKFTGLTAKREGNGRTCGVVSEDKRTERSRCDRFVRNLMG